MSKLNIPAIAQVIGYITLFENKHNQDTWMNRGSDHPLLTAEEVQNSCETTACLAGWVANLNAPVGSKFGGNSYFFIADPDGEFIFQNGKMVHHDFSSKICIGEQHYSSMSYDSFSTKTLGIYPDIAYWLYYTAENSEIVPALQYLVNHPYADIVEIVSNVSDTDTSDPDDNNYGDDPNDDYDYYNDGLRY
jgi:hypothetical protein